MVITITENGQIVLNKGKMQFYLTDEEAENLAIQLMGAIERKATLIKTENQISLEFNREDY